MDMRDSSLGRECDHKLAARPELPRKAAMRPGHANKKANQQKFFGSFFQKRTKKKDSSFLKKRSKKLLLVFTDSRGGTLFV
jgi:hypothetical protein